MELKMNREEFVENWSAESLKAVGVYPNLDGYKYLMVALKILEQCYGKNMSITKELYPLIASACDSTAAKVERGIRHALGKADDRKGVRGINEVVGSEVFDQCEKPSNKQALYALAEALHFRLLREGYAKGKEKGQEGSLEKQSSNYNIISRTQPVDLMLEPEFSVYDDAAIEAE